MKSNILITGLSLALVIVTIQWMRGKQPPITTSNNDTAQVVMENLTSRTSVRKYQPQTIELDKQELLIRAAMAAPSGANKQPWHFIVVRDKEILEQLATANSNAPMLKDAPLAIVVCGDLTKALEGTGKELWVQDCSASAQNILLAAHALGLGAVWTAVYPAEELVNAVSEILMLPDNIIPLCTIAVGYPAETPTPKNKWKPENISYNGFGITDDNAAHSSDHHYHHHEIH